MRRRVLYTLGVLLLFVLTGLVVWQVSFSFGDYGPTDLSQTFIFWAVSTLVFVLTVTLGFILFRNGFKLYLERYSNREGSRIKSKLFFGAFALSFLPVCSLVGFSYVLLNRTLEKWFFRPGEELKVDFIALANEMDRQQQSRLRLEAQLLLAQPGFESIPLGRAEAQSVLKTFAQTYGLAAAEIRMADDGDVLARYGPVSILNKPGKGWMSITHPAETADGRKLHIALAARVPYSIDDTKRRVSGYVERLASLQQYHKSIRAFYILMQTLIALFVLFVSCWIALILARQISQPISALLKAADAVGEGNFSHRIEISAIDELGRLVRGFNTMTAQLEANTRELDARRRFTEAILESIPTGVISLSSDGTIQRVNRALHNIFPEERVAQAHRLEDLVPRDESAEIRYMMKRARRTGIASREFDINTGKRNLHLSVTVSALEYRVTSGFVVVFEDLSDLLRAQKSAAWHEVARRIAHEIKNPLTPIALSAARINRQVEKYRARTDYAAGLNDLFRIIQECAGTITVEAESVKTLVDEFSHFARFPTAQPSRADLNEVVESALAVFEDRLDGIKLHVHLLPGLPPVSLDRDQFKRVVVNLVDNAAEAMQDAAVKELYVTTQSTGPGIVTLTVTDTGCGVSQEDKEKLFLPYFSTKGRGTGLGLAIVNHILSEHGAKIRVEDNIPAGASFIVEIPAILELAAEPEPVTDPAVRA
jgi:PAS domain S-box-containing protein